MGGTSTFDPMLVGLNPGHALMLFAIRKMYVQIIVFLKR